jgi:hypothetical protein
LDARFTEYDLTALGGANYSGNRVRNTPRTTLNAGYQHQFGLRGAGNLLARVDTQWASRQFTDTINSVGGTQTAMNRVR